MPALRRAQGTALRGLLAVATFVFACAAIAGEVAVTPVRVSEHAWYVQGQAGVASSVNQGFNSNAGFIVTPDGIVVIDALGTPALGRALLKAIRTVSDKPIKRLIITHYHADHFYGLQAFKDAGAEVWAHKAARAYLDGGEAAARLEQRQRDLAPWIDKSMHLIHPDRWLDGNASFTLGGINFGLVYAGPAHAPDDMIVFVREDQLLFSGDIVFSGRVPFVGDADSKHWLADLDELLKLKPRVMVPGHGSASRDAVADLVFTRDYLRYLRSVMGKAADDMEPFDEAYAKVDWTPYQKMPAFDAANRTNAYGTYLQMERESLRKN